MLIALEQAENGRALWGEFRPLGDNYHSTLGDYYHCPAQLVRLSLVP